MILTGADCNTWTEVCPNVTLSTTNPTWTGVAEENNRIRTYARERK